MHIPHSDIPSLRCNLSRAHSYKRDKKKCAAMNAYLVYELTGSFPSFHGAGICPKIRAKKVFNNEEEFGIIPNKPLKGSRFRCQKGEKTNFFSSKLTLKDIMRQSIYKSFTINIQIVFDLYINRFQSIYRSQVIGI
ncbi:hypothetical protein HR15_11205 [Porphyromonas gulae]|uniref:Uncharacterized protein n=1 Tax=Porphyromonas gulae TaxID=111105 RepID=A0A0A2F2J8_9PORP|nr:hypothetical protein HR15_11205 [Porphyromonas gulae]